MRRAFLLFAGMTLLAAGHLQAAAPVEKPKKISFPTRDAQTLAALWRKPAPGKSVIVLLHGLQSTKEEWNDFSEALAKNGWGTLAYDARGHGANDKDKKGLQALGAPGPGSNWERMVDDLGSALRFLESQGIVRSSVAVCGASLGANVAARYAALSSPLQSLVLMSPGNNYMEFKPEGDVVRIKTRTLIIASPEDKYAFQSSLRFKNLAPADELWTDVPPGHGVQMLTPVFAERLAQWLNAQR